ncbi:MAG: right-handed parallel beta-helix repeat-containing protein [Kiritimatiellae bacterium]|nr:right-handed parallel beta-helix repeat-containing protein [Kiritimatiellia bacterium]
MFGAVMLPDGTVFETWERPLSFSKTFHVARGHARADDDNPGTEDRPWATIGRAAQVLQPGERVLVHSGTYREWVKPAQGGTGPDAMISYQAAPGEAVILKGSEEWTPAWERTEYFRLPDATAAWQARLDPRLFEGANPFCLQNFPDQGHPDWKSFPSFELRRGQLFADGVPLVQVKDYERLADGPGRFWVEDNGMTVHVRPPRDADPGTFAWEITAREQVFAPLKRYLNYIHVRGFKMFHSANGVPIPPPQRGLLSATAGHHWIVEDCEIGHANTLGMDVGGQWWSYGKGEMQGFHIIRRNYIHHCGVSAISGWHNMANERMLVEDNLVTDCCWMPITHHFESAGIKIHRTEHSVIRRNVILRTANCASLWLDGEILNTRITQNLFAEAADPVFGHVFLEINQGPNLVDNNIMLNSGGHGFYEHDAERVVLLQNLIANGYGSAVHMRYGDPRRVNPPFENEHQVFANIITGFPRYIHFPNRTCRADLNLYGERPDAFRQAFMDNASHGQEGTLMNLEEWRKTGRDGRSATTALDVSFDAADLTLRLRAPWLKALPAVERLPGLLPKVAPADKLLAVDYLGQPRPERSIQVGPLLNPPLDGTPICIDPRRLCS